MESAEGLEAVMPKLSFCESVVATGVGKWHLRLLTDKGPKYGGGIDTDSLCGRVRAGRGWDAQVAITEYHKEHNTCAACLKEALDWWLII